MDTYNRYTPMRSPNNKQVQGGPAAKLPLVDKPMRKDTGGNNPSGYKPNENKPEKRLDINIAINKIPISDSEVNFSQERLQEYIVWSEILGKPVCRRRKRR